MGRHGGSAGLQAGQGRHLVCLSAPVASSRAVGLETYVTLQAEGFTGSLGPHLLKEYLSQMRLQGTSAEAQRYR